MHPKDADGMANSVDPDQTASSEAVWSWSALFADTYLSQYIEFTVNQINLRSGYSPGGRVNKTYLPGCWSEPSQTRKSFFYFLI